MSPFPLEPPSRPHPTTEPWFEFPESYSRFPLPIYVTHGNVSVAMILSPFAPPSPSSHVPGLHSFPVLSAVVPMEGTSLHVEDWVRVLDRPEEIRPACPRLCGGPGLGTLEI